MSRISHLLVHRCAIKRLNQTNVDGQPTYDWVIVKTNVKCRLNLQAGDPNWTPEAGRQPDRNGLVFMDLPKIAKPGDRLEMIKGPSGTYELASAPDGPLIISRRSPGFAILGRSMKTRPLRSGWRPASGVQFGSPACRLRRHFTFVLTITQS